MRCIPCMVSAVGRPYPPPGPDFLGGRSAPAARLSQCSGRTVVVIQMNPVPHQYLSGEEERELSFCRVREGEAGGGCCAFTHFRGGLVGGLMRFLLGKLDNRCSLPCD